MRLVLPALAALTLATLGTTAVAAPQSVGGECDGLVDVDCDDYYRDFSCGPGTCPPPEYEGHCVAWVAYLDTTLQPEHRPVLCADHPYP
ncbi:MAG TPA: hypothetical protein VHH36_04350 [Candidatus Thermoplasmatota archaeon]|nr:hypothetical protein [Candidatus Thermoplasmatota archaeon]